MRQELREFHSLLILIVVVILLGVFWLALNLPFFIIDQLLRWSWSALIGFFSSIAVANLVEFFTGDLLKKLSLTFSFKGVKVSISAFTVTTLVIRIWLFGF